MADKKKIFIVDDDEIELRGLTRLLEISGFQVGSTQNPQNALSMVTFYRPGLILLDLITPSLGGFEVCDLLASCAATRDIPILIVSAVGGFKDIKKIVHERHSQNIVGCMAKPYEFKDLLAEINRVVK
ncbi:MAG: response regulator [Candidatus Omnitrophota bacterium]